MITTNWTVAKQIEEKYPLCYQSMQELMLAMEEAHKKQGVKTWYGKDLGYITTVEYHLKLKVFLEALRHEGLVTTLASSAEYHGSVMIFFRMWFQIFPNWTDVCVFVEQQFEANQEESWQLIRQLMKLKV